MLRTVHHHEPALVKFCQQNQWDAVMARLKSHPAEAIPTDAALRGQGSTVLAAAVRYGADLTVIKALLDVSVHQMGVIHRTRGSVLHEACLYRAPIEVLSHLIRVTSDYQKSYVTNHPEQEQPTFADGYQFTHVGVQESRVVSCPDIFLSQDDMGRTALHLMVDRIKRLDESASQSRDKWEILHSLVRGGPRAVNAYDCDGNTPLLLLLQSSRGPRSSRNEAQICSLAEVMLSACPDAAGACKRVVRPWKLQSFFGSLLEENPSNESVNQSPLYFALLNGRPLELILLLLKQNNIENAPSPATIVTQNHEVPLHIAISTRAPLSVVYHVASECPQAILVEDVYGLNSIDWLWIRHVLDWHASPLDVSSSRIVSRRRLIDNKFPEWHPVASGNIPMSDNATLTVNPVAVRGLQEDLLQRIKLLLPMAASLLVQNRPYAPAENWSLLHASCCVPCPIAMVRAALNMVGESHQSIQSRDLRSGRLPLHYAAARAGYSATVPIGVSRSIHVIREQSPVFDIVSAHPESCFERDCDGQLPFHIAIDTATRNRAPLLAQNIVEEVNSEEIAILSELLTHYPGALECRDGKTRLYPWQQAAVGYGSSLNTVYFLLRLQPTMLRRR